MCQNYISGQLSCGTNTGLTKDHSYGKIKKITSIYVPRQISLLRVIRYIVLYCCINNAVAAEFCELFELVKIVLLIKLLDIFINSLV